MRAASTFTARGESTAAAPAQQSSCLPYCRNRSSHSTRQANGKHSVFPERLPKTGQTGTDYRTANLGDTLTAM
jgi:hypothetical protein